MRKLDEENEKIRLKRCEGSVEPLEISRTGSENPSDSDVLDNIEQICVIYDRRGIEHDSIDRSVLLASGKVLEDIRVRIFISSSLFNRSLSY